VLDACVSGKLQKEVAECLWVGRESGEWTGREWREREERVSEGRSESERARVA